MACPGGVPTCLGGMRVQVPWHRPGALTAGELPALGAPLLGSTLWWGPRPQVSLHLAPR